MNLRRSIAQMAAVVTLVPILIVAGVLVSNASCPPPRALSVLGAVFLVVGTCLSARLRIRRPGRPTEGERAETP